nr:AbfB domain-containing protein [uncultured Albidiferax sp.]
MAFLKKLAQASTVFFASALLLSGCGGGSDAVSATSTEMTATAGSGDIPPDTSPDTSVAWVMSYFGPNQDLPNDSLHLAFSTDGLNWTGLNDGKPVYQAPTTIQGIAGSGHIRDPYILRKNDGKFVYIATDWTLAVNDSNYWNRPSKRIFVADSTDLITFTNPRFLTMATALGSNTQPHAWAPEAYYDPDRRKYAIVWSGNADRNRTYVSYTKDFNSLVNPVPEVLFDPGYDEIDATVTPYNGHNYLFYKGEEGSGRDIQLAKSSGTALAAGTFTRVSPNFITRGTNQSVQQGVEGPLVIKVPGQNRWYLYADYYGNGGVFGCWTTTDLDADVTSWTKLTNGVDFTLPAGVRHANTVRVTQAQLDALKAHYGVTPPATRIKTTYSEGGTPFYVAHSWFHGMITQLNDTANGQLPADFKWKAVPGLADPTDPNLVSFEATGFAGHYLRIDSANPTRWPTGGSASQANRSYGLGWIATADKKNLTWVDPYVNSSTFKSDATFRKVPALNGDANMVSLQWYGNTTLYLRHMAYQLLGLPSTANSQQKIDASFTLETR